MKRLFNNRLFIFMLGVIISGSSVYAATLLASNVSYDNTNSGISANNVQGAIDVLYNKANNPTIPSNYKDLSTVTTATSSDILLGKTAYNNLGEILIGSTSVTDCIKGTVVINSNATTSSGQLFLNFVPSIVLWQLSNSEYELNKPNGTNTSPLQYSINLTNKSIEEYTNTNLLYTSNSVKLINYNSNDIGESWNYMACR